MPRPDLSAMYAPVADVPGVDLFRAVYRNHRFARHAHDSLAIGVVDSGIGEFWCRGANHRVARHSLVLIAPGEVHTGRSLDPDRPLAYRMVYVDLSESQLLLGSRAPLSFRSAAPSDERVAVAFRVAFDRLLAPSAGSALERQSALVGLLDLLFERHGRPERSSLVSRSTRVTAADEARDLLRRSVADHFSLTELAGRVGVNPRYLIRSFAARFGIPPHAYQMHLRAARGAEMLRKGADISCVALELGFADQSHFTRTFKRVLGVSPGQYRAAHRGPPATPARGHRRVGK